MLAVEVQRLAEHGFRIPAIHSTGGGASSPAWLQIKADALGLPVHRPRSGHGAAQGASYLAGLATGIHEGPETVRPFTSDIESTFMPDSETHARYVQKAEHFRRTSGLNASRGG